MIGFLQTGELITYHLHSYEVASDMTNIWCRFSFLFLCLYDSSAKPFLKGLLTLIKVQRSSGGGLCGVCHLPRVFIMYKVWSEPVLHPTLFLLTLRFSWLTQPFQGHLTFKHVQTHTLFHRWEKSAACSELRLLCPITFVLLILFYKAWMQHLNECVNTLHLSQHSCACTQHAAAFIAPKQWLPSIVPPHCSEEWQLATEEPWARHTLARSCASLLGCFIRAKNHISWRGRVEMNGGHEGNEKTDETCRM